jgi:phosphopantothenoylcysteine decarboxylase/phosphopantothenate--cysteine ligase
MFKGKLIVLGVSGGIAAYKAVELTSLLKKAGAAVQVIMTREATQFLAPLTFQTVSQNPVITDMFAPTNKPWEVEHISLADKADAFVIAPATANVIGKIACGIADDFLTTCVMATKSAVLIAPSMNVNMYENPITQGNIQKLRRLGYRFAEPETGKLACGYEGKGRLPSPEVLLKEISYCLTYKDYEGLNVVVTAGPTREPLDPVRFISNRSTGKMGYALAEAFYARGANVTLISGPVELPASDVINLVKVTTAEEMLERVLEVYESSDIVVKAAAVADYRAQTYQTQKIKKTDSDFILKMVRTPDILKRLGEIKKSQFLVGFAAETEDLIKNAKEKLNRKNLDLIVANDVTSEGAGFGTDTNIVKLITRDGEIKELPKMSKIDVANAILDTIIRMFRQKGVK